MSPRVAPNNMKERFTAYSFSTGWALIVLNSWSVSAVVQRVASANIGSILISRRGRFRKLRGAQGRLKEEPKAEQQDDQLRQQIEGQDHQTDQVHGRHPVNRFNPRRLNDRDSPLRRPEQVERQV